MIDVTRLKINTLFRPFSRWIAPLIRLFVRLLPAICYNVSMNKKNTGVTLLELMITIAIFAILTSMTVPSFLNTLERSRIDSVQQSLARDLAYARQEAISQSLPVSLCRSATGTSCAVSGGWNQGWIAFTDVPGGTPGTVDSGEEVLRVQEAMDGRDDLDATDDYVQFSSRGVLQVPSTGTPEFEICSPENNVARGLLLLRSGSVVPSRYQSGIYYLTVDGGGSPVAISCS